MPNGKFHPSKNKRSIRKGPGSVADWHAAQPDLLRDAIEKASFHGGALRFGYSSDGGAYAIGVYFDGDHFTEFVRPEEDIDLFLQELMDWYDAEVLKKLHNAGKPQNGQG